MAYVNGHEDFMITLTLGGGAAAAALRYTVEIPEAGGSTGDWVQAAPDGAWYNQQALYSAPTNSAVLPSCTDPTVFTDHGLRIVYEEQLDGWVLWIDSLPENACTLTLVFIPCGNETEPCVLPALGVGSGLPPVTEADNDKILMVIDGEWKLTYLPNAVPSTPSPSPTPTPTPTPTPSGYVPIYIEYFSHGITGVKEYGEKITEVNLSWSLSKPAETLTLDGENIGVTETSRKITGLSITQDSDKKEWTLTATDERGAKDMASTTPFSFANGIYYGVATEPAQYNSAFILGLTKKLQDYKVTSFSADAGDGQYIYYCLPARLGACSFTFGPFTGGFDLVSSIDFTNAKGYTEKYNIYRSDYDNLGQTSLTVS